MSEMRLRHRKPINSYAGQVNQHTNEANDQDFARNSIQFKKPKFLKTKSPLDQNKRYAEILCQFVQAINKDYRQHCERFTSGNETIPLQDSKKNDSKKENEEKIKKVDASFKNHEVVSKQQKIGKQEFQNSAVLPNKKIKRDRNPLNETPKNEVPPTFTPKPVPNISLQTKNPPPPPVELIQPTSFEKPKPNTMNPQGMSFMSQFNQMSPMASLQQIQQYQQMQQMFQNPMYSMNPAMYSMYPYQMNYQFYMEQLKQNPYAMQGMMGMMPTGIAPNYIPFSKLPFQRNSVTEQKKQLKVQQQPQPPVQQKKQQKFIVTNEQTVIKPDVYGQSGNQPIDFKKKSCYHVAISYNIHFGRMKQKGLFSNINSKENLEKLDPTFAAKKIRQRKVSENVANINDNTST